MRAALARVGAWGSRRPVLSAALLYAFLSLAFVAPALLPGKVLSNSDSFWFQAPWVDVKPADYERAANPEIDDIPSQMHPFLQYTRERLPDVPLWNPHITGGRPFIANAQSAIFSPYSAPSYVVPFHRSLALVAALKLFAAAFGMFLLARALGVGQGGSLFAGVAYGFSLWLVTWLAYPHASVWSLIPLLLVATHRLVERPSPGRFAALALVTAAQFLAGHPESSFHAVVFASILFAFLLVQHQRRGSGEGTGRRLLVFGGALALGGAIAAVMLVPFLELLLRSADIDARAGTGDDTSVDPRYLLGFALWDYWGRPTQTPVEIFLLARAYYVGALAVLLAAAALVLRPTSTRVAVAAFGAVCAAVVFGLSPIFDVVTALPGFSSGHNSRLAVGFVLALALLAGWGVRELVAVERPPGRDRLVLAVGALLLVAPLAWVVLAGKASSASMGEALGMVFLFEDAPAGPSLAAFDTVRLASLLGWLVVCGAALLLVALRLRGRIGGTTFAALAVALAVAELFRAGVGYHPAIDRERATQPATGAIRYLETRAPARYVSVGSIPQNVISMRFGLYEARGYDLPIEKRYDRMWRRYLSPELPSVGGLIGAIPLSVPKVTADRVRVLSLLGVSDIMQPAGDRPLRVAGLREGYSGPDARVYANREALPRAWVVGEQRLVEDGDAALDAIGDPAWNPRRSAVVERAVEGLGSGNGGSARVLEYEPERVVVEAESRGAGMLVLSDLHYPGWEARVDGREVDTERANYVMRGVPLEDGRHVVEFRYEPVSWRIGWIVSLIGLLIVAGLAVLGLRRRRSAHAGSGGGSPTA